MKYVTCRWRYHCISYLCNPNYNPANPNYDYRYSGLCLFCTDQEICLRRKSIYSKKKGQGGDLTCDNKRGAI